MKCKYAIIAASMIYGIVSCEAQSLEQLFKEAVASNPGLKGVELQYEAALERTDQSKQLPPLTLGVGAPALRPETRVGPQVLMVSASQMFPWFGTFKSKADVTISMAKSRYEEIAAMKLEIYFHIKTSYYQLYLIDVKRSIIKQNITLLESLERIATSKVEAGKSTIADVLKIQLEINGWKNTLDLLEKEKIKYYSKINTMTRRDVEEPIDVTESFRYAANLDFDLSLYKRRIEEFHPLIAKVDAGIRASEQRQDVNSDLGAPMIGLGLDYSMVNERVDANPEFNGRDILIPKLMLSVPLSRKTYKSVEEEEKLTQRALAYEKEDLISRMLESLMIEKSNYESALLDILLADLQIETAGSAYEVMLSDYSGNDKGIDELIDIQNDLLKFRLDRESAVVRTYLSKAAIERITDF